MINSKNKFNAPEDCGRKEDLVAYLYDEAGAAERASFERHLDDCVACRAELMAFGRVRDELSVWQVGLAPRAEVVLPRSRFAVLRELIGMFPMWVRGAALAGAAAAMLLVALSIAGASVGVRDGDFAINFGRSANAATAAPAPSSQEIERQVQNAIAREREKLQRDFDAQLAGLKEQIGAERQERLQAASAEYQAQLQAVKAELRREIQRSNRQNSSIRSFFAVEGEGGDPWGDVR